jgi:hypothetical protein
MKHAHKEQFSVQFPSKKDPFAVQIMPRFVFQCLECMDGFGTLKDVCVFIKDALLQRCVGFITFVIFFTPSCKLFIPLKFISFPNDLFLYLVQDFHTYLV